MSEKKEKEQPKELTLFEKLSAIDVSAHIEKKNGLSYLSWAWAWGIFKKHCPDATYKVIEFEGGKKWLLDKELGYMVFTEVAALGETHSMWLPVMNGANKAMKDEPYTYTVKEWHPTERGVKIDVEKRVEPATMFDINTAIMRCLVKNLAMFGLGLYIYAGEDLPESEDAPKQASKTTSKQAPKETAKPASKEPITDEEHEALRQAIADAPDMDALKNAYMAAHIRAKEAGDKPALDGYIKIKDIRKAELEQQTQPQEA